MASSPKRPRGRFAPSPTGPLHMGSLITAIASYLDIKHLGGTWCVRIDDIDPPRAVDGAVEAIIAGLEAHALRPDLPIQYQSEHAAQHQAALDALSHRSFFCGCTRGELAGLSVYPGSCRARGLTEGALRLQVEEAVRVEFDDFICGPQAFVAGQDFGDTIIRRKDGLLSYHLATAVDDGRDFDRILRGRDLLETTPIQIHIMHLLELDVPSYGHLPLLRFPDGTKLSKQAHAPALDLSTPVENIMTALDHLGLRNAPADANASPDAALRWAQAHWDTKHLPAELAPFAHHPA